MRSLTSDCIVLIWEADRLFTSIHVTKLFFVNSNLPTADHWWWARGVCVIHHSNSIHTTQLVVWGTVSFTVKLFCVSRKVTGYFVWNAQSNCQQTFIFWCEDKWSTTKTYFFLPPPQKSSVAQIFDAWRFVFAFVTKDIIQIERFSYSCDKKTRNSAHKRLKQCDILTS